MAAASSPPAVTLLLQLVHTFLQAHTMAAAADAAPPFDPDSFDEDDPQGFYLWERRGEMEAMADACLIVEGTRLPVHSHVLSLASGVLCRMFADLQSADEAGGAANRTRGHKRKAGDGEQVGGSRVELPATCMWLCSLQWCVCRYSNQLLKVPISQLTCCRVQELTIEAPFPGSSVQHSSRRSFCACFTTSAGRAAWRSPLQSYRTT